MNNNKNHSPNISFSDILDNKSPSPYSLRDLQVYLLETHSIENLNFVLKVRSYRKQYTECSALNNSNTNSNLKDKSIISKNNDLINKLQQLWRNILNTYIEESSPFELNLPWELRDQIIAYGHEFAEHHQQITTVDTPKPINNHTSSITRFLSTKRRNKENSKQFYDISNAPSPQILEEAYNYTIELLKESCFMTFLARQEKIDNELQSNSNDDTVAPNSKLNKRRLTISTSSQTHKTRNSRKESDPPTPMRMSEMESAIDLTPIPSFLNKSINLDFIPLEHSTTATESFSTLNSNSLLQFNQTVQTSCGVRPQSLPVMCHERSQANSMDKICPFFCYTSDSESPIMSATSGLISNTNSTSMTSISSLPYRDSATIVNKAKTKHLSHEIGHKNSRPNLPRISTCDAIVEHRPSIRQEQSIDSCTSTSSSSFGISSGLPSETPSSSANKEHHTSWKKLLKSPLSSSSLSSRKSYGWSNSTHKSTSSSSLKTTIIDVPSHINSLPTILSASESKDKKFNEYTITDINEHPIPKPKSPFTTFHKNSSMSSIPRSLSLYSIESTIQEQNTSNDTIRLDNNSSSNSTSTTSEDNIITSEKNLTNNIEIHERRLHLRKRSTDSSVNRVRTRSNEALHISDIKRSWGSLSGKLKIKK